MWSAPPSAFGPVDTLVNNAVVMHWTVEDFVDEHWDQAPTVNLTAPAQLLKLALPGVKQRRCGRIVDMSSVNGLRVNRPGGSTTSPHRPR